jgi:hypothetical protein
MSTISTTPSAVDATPEPAGPQSYDVFLTRRRWWWPTRRPLRIATEPSYVLACLHAAGGRRVRVVRAGGAR